MTAPLNITPRLNENTGSRVLEEFREVQYWTPASLCLYRPYSEKAGSKNGTVCVETLSSWGQCCFMCAWKRHFETFSPALLVWKKRQRNMAALHFIQLEEPSSQCSAFELVFSVKSNCGLNLLYPLWILSYTKLSPPCYVSPSTSNNIELYDLAY